MDRRTIEIAIHSLDALLTADSSAESDYQSWFEANPIVMVALGFRRAIPHPVVPLGDGKSYVPDFLVQTANEAWEILELKTPQAAVLRDRERRATFYATFNTYLSQCHDYAEAFDDRAAREAFQSQNGFAVQRRPHAIIVAGRSSGLSREEVWHLTSRYTPPIRHFTFDDILAQLEHYRLAQYAGYDTTKGVAIIAIVRLFRPPQPYVNNHIFDWGERPDRDRVSVFLNPKGYLRMIVFDSNGRRYEARSEEPFSAEDYGRVHYLYFDVGIAERFAFLTMEIDGQYYADLRLQDFPFQLPPGAAALGTSADGTGESWMDVARIWAYDRPTGFSGKARLRQFALGQAKRASAPGGRFVSFRGRQGLRQERHASATSATRPVTPAGPPRYLIMPKPDRDPPRD